MQSSSINRTQTILIILLIAIAGLLIRLVFYPYNIPISADAMDYFSYSIALARGDIFPVPGGGDYFVCPPDDGASH